MGQNSGLLSSLTDWNSTLAGYADSISTGVVMPVALTLLDENARLTRENRLLQQRLARFLAHG